MIFSPISSLVKTLHSRREKKEAIALESLKARYHAFRIFLENNGVALELIARIDSQLLKGDSEEIHRMIEELVSVTTELVDGLNILSANGHIQVYGYHGRLAEKALAQLEHIEDMDKGEYCLELDKLPRNGENQAGRKAANLARLRRLFLPVPDGFVCTVIATKRFLKMGKLAADIQRILRQINEGRLDLNRAAERMKTKIMDAPLPDDLAQALQDNFEQLSQRQIARGRLEPLAISVRSSGVAEDGVEHSFAGQFTSVLNVVDVPSLFVAFKEVIASGFSARAISYRMNAGYSPLHIDLAVLCQVMARVDCAGVLFTVDPSEPESDRMLISAVPGLGTLAVGGISPADLYYPPRSALGDPFAQTEHSDKEFSCQISPPTPEQRARLMDNAQITPKTVREIPLQGGGVRQEELLAEESCQPLLDPWALARLMYFGVLLENLWGMAQDIEWGYSRKYGFSLLQARPLRLAAKKGRKSTLETTNRLLEGICASSGKVVGCIQRARSLQELENLSAPDSVLNQRPTILVLPQSIVDASNLLPLCRGAIIDIGNPTDHLSCIARELGMPMLVGSQEASTCLEDDQWIVLDADHGAIFEASETIKAAAMRAFTEKQEKRSAGKSAGNATQQSSEELTRYRASTIAPEREELRKLISPLNLTDAYGSTFSILECRSIHDIIRYCHEMTILAMFSAGDSVMDFAGGLLRALDVGVPFSFLVIDLGGGVRRAQESFLRKQLAIHKTLGINDVLSIPLKALCEGLMTPGLCYHSAPTGAGLSTILSRTMLDKRTQRPAGSFNYALTARDYLNLNAKVEFHFAMLDSICGRNNRANYIRFRFKGGGASPERGHRRVRFLQQVLEENGFFTTVVGDLITASFTGASKERVYDKLVMIGRLLGYSRFLDGIMENDDSPPRFARAFLEGRYDSRDLQDEDAARPQTSRNNAPHS